ncbi:MAG: ABC transporter permease subunit, partial [Candidatus Limnocylindria bacterium]
ILAIATMLLQAFIVSIGLRQFASEIATMIALTALAIPPILTNAYVGISQVDDDLVEAGRGMGMREGQILREVEVPVALPVILVGVRTAAVQVVATATLGAVFATGGLGRFIIDGIAQRRFDEVFAGAIVVAILSILTELAFEIVQRRVTSPGLRGRRIAPREPAQAGRRGGEMSI